MLFNSYEYIFLFLPITVFLFFLLGRQGYIQGTITLLIIVSFIFYGLSNPVYLVLLLFSIIFNYAVSLALMGRLKININIPKKAILTLGIAVNIALIGYFKYTDFFISTINSVFQADFNLTHIIWPLGISFFTFQQIAYLVDTYRGEVQEANFLKYGLFVSFFPYIMAGPIVRHQQIVPQLNNKEIFRLNNENVAIGLTIFFIGLFKKVVLADQVATYANLVFNAAANGNSPNFLVAWCGVFAYTLQLYFDFSGYSDMAIGTARILGIKLPLNFNSPYQSVNISEFWRRWHITLSNFLHSYGG
jgi:alginate O-acetyltransferase complex protein AlgI